MKHLGLTPELEQLRSQANQWGVDLSDSQLTVMGNYAKVLDRYEAANVMGTRDATRIILEHLIDALSCYLVQDLHRASSLIDVGAGGGLPGIPLSIVRSDLRVTLLEAVGKKVRFLNYARAALGLTNLEVLHARAEEAAKNPAYREAFQVASARALATLPVVVEYCAPLVRVGGTILAMKGALAQQELSVGVAAARKLGVEFREVREVKYQEHLPQKERNLVVLDKVAATPGRFPRRVGVAKKRPLGV
ncbi:MAG TPA: 16S rRNA (guanine(527)-N(7))-methyltransferase RsmG [Rubrobacteraceae bacterium]|nr:16S rRNA (guanine(527)-N(7))-methyltransferase RsmG [Rubrobacteraceae bacterium]